MRRSSDFENRAFTLLKVTCSPNEKLESNKTKETVPVSLRKQGLRQKRECSLSLSQQATCGDKANPYPFSIRGGPRMPAHRLADLSHGGGQRVGILAMLGPQRQIIFWFRVSDRGLTFR